MPWAVGLEMKFQFEEALVLVGSDTMMLDAEDGRQAPGRRAAPRDRIDPLSNCTLFMTRGPVF